LFQNAPANRPKDGFSPIFYLLAHQEERIQLWGFGIGQETQSAHDRDLWLNAKCSRIGINQVSHDPSVRLGSIRSILELIGNTPLVQLKRIAKDVRSKVYAKLELLNPSGSVKDRIAKYMIESAERKGILKKSSIIAEATTGNTGISFAMMAKLKGYRMIVVMPEGMSEERKRIIKLFGGEIIFTPGGESDVDKCLKKVAEIAKDDQRIWVAGQFTNKDNVLAHHQTGREIIQQVSGRIDAFVAGVGTGGTLTGVAEMLKKKHPRCRIVAVEPAECAILSGGSWGRHRIEGIGDGFIPSILRRDLIDEVIAVRDSDAINWARRLALEEGIFGGISSGANVYASVQVAKKISGGGSVVTIIPDSGMRYLSTDLAKF